MPPPLSHPAPGFSFHPSEPQLASNNLHTAFGKHFIGYRRERGPRYQHTIARATWMPGGVCLHACRGSCQGVRTHTRHSLQCGGWTCPTTRCRGSCLTPFATPDLSAWFVRALDPPVLFAPVSPHQPISKCLVNPAACSQWLPFSYMDMRIDA